MTYSNYSKIALIICCLMGCENERQSMPARSQSETVSSHQAISETPKLNEFSKPESRFDKPVSGQIIDPFLGVLDQAPESLADQLKSAYEKEDYKTALSLLKNLLQDQPNDEQILYQIGICYFRLNDFPRSLPYVKRALSLNDQLVSARRLQGVLLLQKKRFSDAITDFNFVLSKEPSDAQSLLWKASSHLNLRQPEVALIDADRALKIPSASLADAYYIKTLALIRLNKLEAAQECLELTRQSNCSVEKLTQLQDEFTAQNSQR